MIQSKEDYRFFLEADRIALKMNRKRPCLFRDDVWKFERLLRKTEYFQNCKTGFLSKKCYFNYLRLKLHKMGIRLGFLIPRNVFGPGLSISHYGPILVSDKATVGANCRIHPCVTIGVAGGSPNYAPRIGNNVFIGPGAVIVGNIEIADGIAVGANSFVNKSFREPDITIAGNPARKVSNNGSKRLYLRATEILEARGRIK